MSRSLGLWLAAVVIPAVLAAPPARADGSKGESAAIDGLSTRGSVSSRHESWLVMPAGDLETGAELSFIQAPAAAVGGGGELAFTDVMLFRPHLRYSVAGRVEVLGGASILAKQPSDARNRVLQSAAVGARVGVGKKLAGQALLTGGTLLAGAGLWGTASASLLGRKVVEETLSFQGELGASGTKLDHDLAAAGAPWFAEIYARAETLIGAPNHIFAAWFGAEYRVPVAHGTGGGPALDPQTRVNVEVGMVYAPIRSWDVYVQLAFVDRGDLRDPATTLPVLDGGFDQRQIMFGVVRRFGAGSRGDASPIDLAY